MSTNEYKSFNLGNGIEDYILPSLNLSPKVHKLKERASIDNEKLLTGRPIITGYGWCTIEASKFLQRSLKCNDFLSRGSQKTFIKGRHTTIPVKGCILESTEGR